MKLELNLAVILLISLIAVTNADSPTKAVNISMECTIGDVNYIYFGIETSCTAKGRLNIVNMNTTVTSIDGGCSRSNPNPRIRVFYVVGKVVQYVPSGLDVLFPNLMGFRFVSTQMKLVTKESLQPYPNLLMFASVGNQIEYLEKDLFMYNTKIEYISLRSNRISYIDPTVFSVIGNSLQQLYMEGQAIACGIGNTITPNSVKNALSKLSSSICADITNAPPLYILLLELKEQLASGGNESSTCQEELTACNGNLTEIQTNLTALNEEVTQLTTELETLNTTLLTANEELQSCNATAETCATDLETCQAGSGGTCTTDLATCEGDLATAEAATATCESDKATCDGDLVTCEADKGTCDGDLTTCNDGKAFCENCRINPGDIGCV
ncbi:unnamed protein product [Chironomus riparius]|uniref:Uncharacterized protein n=1 Tax=Chironomus riparius TaxID=315576 RepID=A0A9N9S877_9DIPT|nr:unnamed protein product [Chironomus riparius]